MYFKIKNVKKDTEGHFIMIKGIMHQEEITHQYLCSQSGSPEIGKAITNRTKRRNRLKHYCSRGPKYPTIRYGQIIQTENQ